MILRFLANGFGSCCRRIVVLAPEGMEGGGDIQVNRGGFPDTLAVLQPTQNGSLLTSSSAALLQSL